MQKEYASIMIARSYLKQAQREIPDDKTSHISTRDVIEHSMYDDKHCVVKKREERQD